MYTKKKPTQNQKKPIKKKAIVELHPWKMVWQNCPVSWKFWFPGVISLTMDCCSTQSKITPCNAALENHFELPNLSLKVVLHRPFLILRPMQNLVYYFFDIVNYYFVIPHMKGDMMHCSKTTFQILYTYLGKRILPFIKGVFNLGQNEKD